MAIDRSGGPSQEELITSNEPDSLARRVSDILRDGGYVEPIHSEDDGGEVGFVVYRMDHLLEMCADAGITDVSRQDVSRWLSRSSRQRTVRLAGIAGSLLQAYLMEQGELRAVKPLETAVEDVEAHRRQREDWARGLDWLAQHYEFSRPAQQQLGDAFVALAAEADEPGTPGSDLGTLTLGEYLSRAVRTGDAAAIDAFCTWARTCGHAVKREQD
jgi:hypothetical protein